MKIKDQSLALCYAIEAAGASEALTKCSVLASELLTEAKRLEELADRMKRYAALYYPPNEQGQVDFARALVEGYAGEMEQPEPNVHMSQPGGPIPAEGQTEANTDGASSGLALGAGFGENDRAELAMLRELVGVRADAPACTADAQHWLKLMADRDIMIRQRALLEEINEALTEMGWHTDRGILQRVKTLLASSPND